MALLTELFAWQPPPYAVRRCAQAQGAAVLCRFRSIGLDQPTVLLAPAALFAKFYVLHPVSHDVTPVRVLTMQPPIKRCSWAETEIMIAYHDNEWGVPVHDDRLLFEFLILEGAQAGLSWSTILNKRQNYRRAFDNFNARKIAEYDSRKTNSLLADAGIVRNRLKIAAAIQNAKAFLAVQEEFGSLDAYIWRFVGDNP